MTKQYIVELTDAEDKALSVVAIDQHDWILNVAKERCRIAIEEIVSAEVQRLLAEGKPITGTKEDIVLAADIETAAERQLRMEEEFRKFQEEQQG
jgi:hypothetical protein